MIRRVIQITYAAFLLGSCWSSRSFAQTTNSIVSSNALQAEMDTAIHQVEKIVNQPVTAYRRTGGMEVGRFEGGWFHAGALKPDFSNVDVRKTQDTSAYDKYEWATSDLNPGLVWPAKQLEFNSMTKYFYTNRNIPKKRLTPAEMDEINRLYRIIGRCEHQLLRMKNQQDVAEARDAKLETDGGDSSQNGETAGPAKRPRLLNPYIGGGAIAVLVLILLAVSFLRKR
jgi:hypothetical protein